jgi:hypothetical protein
MMFQFKTFGYGQVRLLNRALTKEVADKQFGRATRNLIVMATLFPAASVASTWFRALLTGKDNDKEKEGWQHYLEAIVGSGSLGLLGDTLQSGIWGRGLELAAGPTIGMVGETIDLGARLGNVNATAESKKKALRRYLKRHLPFGQTIGRVFD